MLSCFCSSNEVVSVTVPSTTLIADVSRYSSNNFQGSGDVAGEISNGFNTTAFPAAIAPMTGSIDNIARQKAYDSA
jgi:hypothetical protein